MKYIAHIITVSVFILLVGCGGGGNSDTKDEAVTFTIGGSVSGLSGEIVLQNNGEGELLLIANGVYTFSAQLSNATDYSVTIQTQPVGQICSVQNEIGIISSANVGNIVITCVDIDTDKDGLSDNAEKFEHGTNPLIPDTDGDGFTDFDEIITKAFNAENANLDFNPLIADEPNLEIKLASAPNISITYTFTEGEAQTATTERSDTNSIANSSSWGGSSSRAVEKSHTESISATIGADLSLDGPGLSSEVTAEVSETTTNSNTTTVDWSKGQTDENSRTLSNAIGIENSKTASSTNGNLQMAVIIKNVSDINYVVNGFTLSSFINDFGNAFNISPIATLSLLDASNAAVFPPLNLQPGAQSPPLIFSAELSVDTAKNLLKNSNNLVIQPVVGQLTNGDSFNFEGASTNIRQRTAIVSIDAGPNTPIETFRVATDLNGTTPGITFNQAMTDILKIPFTTGEELWRYGPTLNTLSFKGITSVRERAMDETKTAYWLVTHKHSADNGASTQTDTYNLLLADYDLGSLVLNKQDELRFYYMQDQDRDGLGDRSEFLHGTDPIKPDTDGDKLTDLFEVVGWNVQTTSETKSYSSDPLKVNTDGDAIDDLAEFQIETDPRGFNFTSLTSHDTGISNNQCYAGSDTLGACAIDSLQDSALGRDANPDTNSDTDGRLGFKYVKICSDGVGLLKNRAGGPGCSNSGLNNCLLDGVTGLLWNNEFNDIATNYTTDHPIESYDTPLNSGFKTASEIVAEANSNKQCGHDDWRIPSLNELLNIADFGNPDIDNSSPWKFNGFYISSTNSSRDGGRSFWTVSYIDNVSDTVNKGHTGRTNANVDRRFANRLMLVRGGK